MNNQASNVIALPTANRDMVGAITWWRLSGTCTLKALEAAWEKQGLDVSLLPSLPSAKVALTRAIHDLRETHRFARKIRGGWALVEEHVGGEKDLDYSVSCRAFLDETKELHVTPGNHPLLDSMQAGFRQHQGQFLATDIGSWLSTKIVPKVLDAVPLRDTGGVYFVRQDMVEMFARIRAAVQEATNHYIEEIPAMRSDEAVGALLRSLEHEANSSITKMEEILTSHTNAVRDPDGEVRPLGTKALESRAKECDALISKLKKFEDLLDSSLEKFTDQLEELSASSMEAIFALDKTKEKTF